MQTNRRINLPSWKRAFCRGLVLYGFLVCLAVSGAAEISRTYDYKGFDTNGNLLVTGVITVMVEDSVQVKGDWKLQILDRSRLKELGPQDGSGKILGLLTGDRIFLNLSPDEYENNIFLDGRVRKSNVFKITGKWGYYGFVGKLNEGSFEMVRRKEPLKKP
jgi:hypothetical protein